MVFKFLHLLLQSFESMRQYLDSIVPRIWCYVVEVSSHEAPQENLTTNEMLYFTIADAVDIYKSRTTLQRKRYLSPSVQRANLT